MKQIPAINLLLAMALNLFVDLPSAWAAYPIWNGGGSDNFWNTGANWGGTAPVNSDSPIFNGVIRQNNTNDIVGLITGPVTFNNGGFVLNGNQFRINGSSTAFITNSAGLNVIANDLTFGSAVAKYWFVAPGSELRITGVITNTAVSGTSIGWLNLTNGGTVRIMNSATSTRGMDLFQGTVIADGRSAVVDCSNDGIVLKPPTGSTVNVVLTNNGTIRIGGGGNFRMGNGRTSLGAPAGSGSISRMDMSSGLLELYGANVNAYVGDTVSGATGIFNQNGGLVWGSAGSGNRLTIGNAVGADGTYNLNGGTLWIAQVRQGNAGAASAIFNFNGGTLKPTGSSTTFFQDVQIANVQNGGAIIDTTNFDITIAQSLQAAGTGGLTKLGTGTLTLSGSSYYTGPTLVNEGTLAISTTSLSGGGAITVANGATLAVSDAFSSISASTLTMGSGGASTLIFNLPNGNLVTPPVTVTSLTGSGVSTINITGQNLAAGQFPLIHFTTATGLGNFHLGTVPPGVNASLVSTANSLDLKIASVVKTLAWSGAANAQWDTNSVNWFDLNNGYTPINYSQSGGFGAAVTFDDTATGPTSIDVTLAVTPVSVTVNNNGYNYSFTGTGKISGIGSLTKEGFQSLTLATANDYSGGTTLNAGNLYMGNDLALGTGPLAINLGTLASDSTTARTVSNTVMQNADVGVILGDTVNSGTLTLTGGLDLAGGTGRTLNFNSDVVIFGSLTNGGITTKTGPGKMIIKGNSVQSGLISQQQGDVIVDGGTITSANGWRLQNLIPGSTVRLIITNGGVFNATIGGNTGNLRVGLTGGDNSSDNVVDIAGTLNLTPTSANVNGNNAVSLGQSGANDILYLRSGGLLVTRALYGLAPGNAEAHFMGGTIRAIANDAGFIAGLTNAFMENGGLTVDTTNFSVTISQPLLAAGNGGLTKIGNGTLTLSGADSYTGATVVNAGKLVLGPAHAATGGITVSANATLAFLQSAPPTTVNVSSATLSGSSALEIQLAVTNAPVAVITNLTLNGSVAVNVSGTFGVGTIPLFSYGTVGGTGSLALGSLPLGTLAVLSNSVPNKTYYLIVTTSAPVIWTGNISGNWDTATTNWSVLNSPAAYVQGANVLFDDSAIVSTVSLTTALTPSSVIVSNNTLNYAFSGSGSLGGNMSLVKDGTNSATLSTPNTYLGTTTVKAGTLIMGNATALGDSSTTVTVENGATLEINGFSLGLKPVILNGGGVGGKGAIVNSGADQNDALRNVTLTGDTTFGGTGVLGLRTSTDTDPGLVANGFKLTKTGSGALNLNGGQTVAGLVNVWFTDIGDIDIQQGTLSFQRRAALGNPTNTITVEPGATLALFSLDPGLAVPTNRVVMTDGSLEGTGAVGRDNTFGGQITLNGNSNSIRVVQWSGASGQTLLYLNGPIIGSGGVQFSASNTVIQLAGNNTYAGNTMIANGTLSLTSSSALAGTAGITLNSNATLDVSTIAPWALGAGQTLGGSGTVNGSVLANGTLAPGTGTGTLTINGDLTLHGNVLIKVNKSLAQPNDKASVSSALSNTGSGVVSVTNLGPALVVGDTFTLFNQPVVGGGAMTIVGAGATWQNNLAVDGSIKVLTVTTGPTSPEPITVVASGGNLNLSWSTIGWRLQSQTNSLATGLKTGWTDVPNSTTTNAMSLPISVGNPTVFFRLVYP